MRQHFWIVSTKHDFRSGFSPVSEWAPLIDPKSIFKAVACEVSVCSASLGFFLLNWDRLCIEFRPPLDPKNPVIIFNAHCLHVCNRLKLPLDVSAILGVAPRNSRLATWIFARISLHSDDIFVININIRTLLLLRWSCCKLHHTQRPKASLWLNLHLLETPFLGWESIHERKFVIGKLQHAFEVNIEVCH